MTTLASRVGYMKNHSRAGGIRTSSFRYEEYTYSGEGLLLLEAGPMVGVLSHNLKEVTMTGEDKINRK